MTRTNERLPMRAIVYQRPEEFSAVDVAQRELQPREVRLKNLIVGVCGTDQHVHVGEFGATYPLIPGHEIVGEIVEIGQHVTALQVGDRIAVDNTIYCMACVECKHGAFGQCLNLGALGINAPGGFAEYCIAEDTKCYPIGDLSLDAAALVEPTACVVHGLDVLDLRPGSDVLITGAGPTSQILAQLIAQGGASRVTMAAPTQFKLDLAAARGVDEVILVDRTDFAKAGPRLRNLAPDGFDVVIEATGAPAVLQSVLPHVRSGGTVMIYGMAAESATITVSPYEIFRRELTIKGSFAQSYGFARAIKYLQTGRIDPAGIITHRFSLDEYQDALDALRAPDCLKAVIEPAR